MPTETFMKLSEEKKCKIIKAAKKEFSRVPFSETSIKKIVEDAEIARGSFYQYFESKEDLLKYLMKDKMTQLENFIKEKLELTKGDIFQVYIEIYDYISEELLKQEDLEFHKKILENMKAMDESSVMIGIVKNEIKGPFSKTELIDLIDKKRLKVESEEELKVVIKMLFLITRKALASIFQHESTKKAREEYVKMIEYLKYGVLR